MTNIWNRLSRKEKNELEHFKRFENHHKMRPDYSCDKNDKKTLMAYRKLIDSLEPEGSTEFNYEPMDLVTTSKKDYIRHPVKPMQQLLQIQKLNNLAIQKFPKDILPDLKNNQDYEYEWLFLERNPTKPAFKDLNDDYTIDSTYSRDFKAHPRAKTSRPPKRQDCLSIRPDSRVEDTTSYSTDFTEHKLPAYYFLPRNGIPRSKLRTDKRYFSPTEKRLIKGYYNPHFNLENAMLKEAAEKNQYSNDTKKYVTMRPKYERTKSLNFDMYVTTPERTYFNNQIINKDIKFRVLETSHRKF